MSTACIVDGVVYISELAGYVHCLDAKTGKRYWVYDTRACIWGSCYYADGKVYLANEDGDVYVFRHDPRPEVLEAPMDAAVRAAREALQNVPPGLDAKVRTSRGREAAKAAARRAQERIAERILIRKIELDNPVRGTPAAVSDTLYIATENKLYAIRKE